MVYLVVAVVVVVVVKIEGIDWSINYYLIIRQLLKK